jgi:NADPH-dependent ferric siderophore reductase
MAVEHVVHLSALMARVTFSGKELAGLKVDAPAASVRLLLPSPGADASGYGPLVIPKWNGNEFLLPDGQRPTIRTFTPRRVDPLLLQLDLDIVLHAGGAVSAWVESAVTGSAAAVSGPGRGYLIDPDAPSFLLAGDESAIPAISQLLEALPASVPVQVIIEIADANARLALPEHPGSTVEWVELPPDSEPGGALIPAFGAAVIEAGARVWAAGEAAAMHRIRRHLFDERGMDRSDVTVRGYWKHGR